MERLRYGLWLARETGLPVAFSGGTGYAQRQGPARGRGRGADRACATSAGRCNGSRPASRDTRENAERSVALLRPAGVTRIVLVTHGWHMRRSLRAFERAIARSGGGIALVAAPMGLARDDASRRPALAAQQRRVSSDTRQALREYLGLLVGA